MRCVLKVVESSGSQTGVRGPLGDCEGFQGDCEGFQGDCEGLQGARGVAIAFSTSCFIKLYHR